MTEFQIDDEYTIIKEKESGFWHYSQNGIMMPKRAEKAFKFYSLNINNIDSLMNSYFHLSNPSSFNDPFDCSINLLDSPEDMETMKSVKRNNSSNLGVNSMTEVFVRKRVKSGAGQLALSAFVKSVLQYLFSTSAKHRKLAPDF